MMKKKNFIFILLVFLGIILFITLISQVLEIYFGGEIAMLYPKGWVALKERNLLFTVQVLMLIVVIPVYFITFLFCWKYRAANTKQKYEPDADNDVLAEIIWWGIPCLIIAVISILTWQRTHELDPYKPLDSRVKPITIQVVALQWKWLFIYPEQKIASVNFFQFPEKTPVNFEITADAPMNSFWIPQLGGQIFAMPKMRTKLHLIAHHAGDYRGSSANISGKGFSGMHFIAKASSETEFNQWVSSVKSSSHALDRAEYDKLASPSENNPVSTYLLKEDDLFEQIIMKYMVPRKK